MAQDDQVTHIESHAAAHLIVIIDDDDAVRESTRSLLEALGYAVRDHPSAESFLASEPADAFVLLVDHHMPGITGAELLEMLHAKLGKVPVVMMTGRSDPTIEARCNRLGAKLLCKPVEVDLLVATIEEARRACTP
jgi:FixJ family two-component response regulator